MKIANSNYRVEEYKKKKEQGHGANEKYTIIQSISKSYVM